MRIHFLITSLLALSLVAAKPPATQPADPRPLEPLKEFPYCPLKVGAQWTYSVSGNGGANQITVLRVARLERIGDTTCARLELNGDDATIYSEHVTVADDGLYRLSIQGEKTDPPHKYFPAKPRKGDTWTVEFSVRDNKYKITYVIDEQDVTVPAGDGKPMHAIVVHLYDGDKLVGSQWYVKGIGMVKFTMPKDDKEMVLELQKFEIVEPPPKAPPAP